MTKMLEVKKDNGVCTITLNRPEVHNAFNDKMIADITQLFRSFKEERALRLVVIEAQGKSFCAGADLHWMKSMISYTKEENIEDSKKLREMFVAINECPIPMIAKVQGACFGGGIGLIACCDHVISSDKAKFAFSEVNLGLIPAVISPFVIAKIGESWARATFLSGRRFDAEEAQKMGLIHQIVPHDELDFALEKEVDNYLVAAPEASKMAKELIRGVLAREGEECGQFTCEMIASKRVGPEGQEGMNALLQKRRPVFKGSL